MPSKIGYPNTSQRRSGTARWLKLVTMSAVGALTAGTVILNLSFGQRPELDQGDHQRTEPPAPPHEQPAVKKAVETVRLDGGDRYHLVFSTSCSARDWQSYLFFHVAMAIGQEGEVTHIISGCDAEEERALRDYHRVHFAEAMNSNFRVHFTPEYSNKRDFERTKYWNKPFGVKHWLEDRFGFSEAEDFEGSTEYDNDIVILIDPDMSMLRPFRNDFSSWPESLWNEHARRRPGEIFHHVERGRVMSQEYGFGAQWLTPLLDRVSKGREADDLAYVLGTDESPVRRLDLLTAGRAHAGGPPYLATAPDFYRIVRKWAEYLPRYYEVRPNMMNEMYCYSLAVAHLGLEHQLARGFMISDTGMLEKEGWGFLSRGKASEDAMLLAACDPHGHDKGDLPQVLHFCQRYGIGEWFLTKYKVPRRTFSCGFPLYEEPPLDVADKTFYVHLGKFQRDEFPKDSRGAKVRAANTFMVCRLYRLLNAAARFYKDRHCAVGDANYNQTWQYFKVYDKDPHGPGGNNKSRSKPSRSRPK